jgi:hypothetical protein
MVNRILYSRNEGRSFVAKALADAMFADIYG